jgi:hypothetical protein
MVALAPQSACQPRPENPRRGWWVREKTAAPPARTGDSGSAATPSGGSWRHPPRDADARSPAPPAPPPARRPTARWPPAAPVSCRALAPRTPREGRSACDRKACRFRAVPESNRVRHRVPGGAAGHVRRSHPGRSPDTGGAAIRRHIRRACIHPPDMG